MKLFSVPTTGRLGLSYRFLASAACLTLALPAHAAAQSAKASDQLRLKEVVVTAQRRRQNLQNVPVSAQVVSSQTLATQNITSLVSLNNYMPSIHIGSSGRSNELYIRGIGSGTNQAFDQSVGVFIDGIYHGRSRFSSGTFLDLERVEILKGPQTLFFGNNAIAGAINIITRKPSSKPEFSARGLYGQHGQYAAEAALGGPLNDVLGARVAVTANGVDGWVKNIQTGKWLSHENNVAGRVTLAFKPTDSFNATLVVGASNNRENGPERQVYNCPPPPPFKAAGSCATYLARGYPTGLDNNLESESGGGGYNNLKTIDSALTMNAYWQGNKITSTSGYYHYDWVSAFPGLPDNGLTVLAPENYRQFSQELRLASAADQRLEYMIGAYYQQDDLNVGQDSIFSFLNPLINALPPFAPLRPLLPIGQAVSFSQFEKNYSLFGSFTFNATDRLKLTVGTRYSSVKKDFTWNDQFGTGTQAFGGIVPLPGTLQPLASALKLGAAGSLAGSRTDKAWQPSARLQYALTRAAMAYVSYSRGFKAGGFNGFDLSANPANYPFAPETVNAYEVGVKSELFDHRLALNLAVSRSDYSNLQVSVAVNSTGALQNVVSNAASVRVDAVEFEARWAASRHISLRLNVDHLNSRYLDYKNAPPTSEQQARGQVLQDMSGEPTMYAPDWSASMSLLYLTELPGESELEAELTPRYSSGYYLFATDDPYTHQGAYTRLDARISLALPDGHWAFDIIGKNLTNETILDYAATVPTSLGSYIASKEQTRNFAAQVRYTW